MSTEVTESLYRLDVKSISDVDEKVIRNITFENFIAKMLQIDPDELGDYSTIVRVSQGSRLLSTFHFQSTNVFKLKEVLLRFR